MTTPLGKILPLPVAALLVFGSTGCLKRIALGAAADALSATGTSYASDEDPELIAAAAPFGLKTMEQVLAEQPRHVGLLRALATGFVSYGVAFVQQDADEAEEKDRDRARPIRERAKRLFLRARRYAERGLEVGHPGYSAAFTQAGEAGAAARAKVLATMKKDDVPLLYYGAAAWVLAIADAKDDMKLVGELPLVEEVMARALALDPDYDRGALHEFYVAYDAARGEAQGGGVAKAKAHFERAVELAQGQKQGVFVSYAESISVPAQDHASFKQLLERVIAFDVDSAPNDRLANLLAQRRARWLLSRAADLFLE